MAGTREIFATNVRAGATDLGYTLYVGGAAQGGRITAGITPVGTGTGTWRAEIDANFVGAVVWDYDGGRRTTADEIQVSGASVVIAAPTGGSSSIQAGNGYSSGPSAIPRITLTAGDRLPPLTMPLVGPGGAAVALPTGTSVRFRMRAMVGAGADIDAPALIVDAGAGLVGFAWRAGDTGAPGEYRAVFDVTFPGGLPQTFPLGSQIPVRIEQPL